jgi:hypothetical protein
MRFMMLLPAPPEVLENMAPNLELVTAMRKYNEDMKKAGVLLASEGLHATSRGKRIKISGGKRLITDGPFTETREVIAGFWIVQAKSPEEALEWANRCPLPEHGLLELRQIFEVTDFAPELQPKAANS